MVSTYVSYMNITANMPTSLERVGKDPIVARDHAYFKENIGKVKTVDEFMGDYRLYAYAMKAHGLEDMTYAQGLMRKVLQSDLNDPTSYANQLTDQRYKTFAATFNFNYGTNVAQNEVQTDEVIGLYKASFDKLPQKYEDETRYFNAAMANIKTVDDLAYNERLRNYILKATQLEDAFIGGDMLKRILTTDLSDPNNFIASSPKSLALAKLFSFDTKGQLPEGGSALSADNRNTINDLYMINADSRTSFRESQIHAAYFEKTMKTATSAQDIVNDPRMLEYIVMAANIGPIIKESDMKTIVYNILTSEKTDKTSFAQTQGDTRRIENGVELGSDKRSNYKWLNEQFNFSVDGKASAGTAINADQLKEITRSYGLYYAEDDKKKDILSVASYQGASGVKSIDSVSELMQKGSVLKFALTAFGLEDDFALKSKLRKVLTSDLSDPKSYVYKLKDQRYVDFAKSFNFDTNGDLRRPVVAQSEADITTVTKAYLSEKYQDATKADKKKAEEEATYYRKTIQKIDSSADFLKDKRLVNVMLVANGYDPLDVSKDFLKKIFTSDVSDPNSFVNTQDDPKWKLIVASYNFDAKGNVIVSEGVGVQTRRGYIQTTDLYMRQMLEEQSAEQSGGVRLALYFERKVPEIKTTYDILSDTPLLEVVKTAFALPEGFESAPVDNQKEMIERYIKVEDLQDPDKLKAFLKRFAALYDAQNDTSQASSLSIMLGAGSSDGISADTLMTMSRLRYRL